MAAVTESPVDFNLAPLHFLRKDFVPYLLNFLREQTSEILNNGPSTPAKTPNSKAVPKPVLPSNQRTIVERRSSQPSGHRGSRVQLFQSSNSFGAPENCFASPISANNDSLVFSRSNLTNTSSRAFSHTSTNSSSSPIGHHNEKRSAQKPVLGNFLVLTPEGQSARRARKKNSSGRHVSKDSSRRSIENESQGENNTWNANKKQMYINTSTSPTAAPLNINNFDEFPPMGASCDSTSKSKPSRRINPTPLNDGNSKTRICFTSTPISTSKMDCSHPGMEVFRSVQEGVCTPDAGSLREEREILRKERSKLLQQTSAPVVLDPITPTKQIYNRSTGVASDMVTYADPGKVSCCKRLQILAKLYSSCITENLVPNIFLEFFFVFQLLTSRGPASAEDKDTELEITRGIKDAVEFHHFQSVHNCVFFAVLVSVLLPATLNSVSFQPETDNRSNFPSDQSFHIFKKQRDVFYELLREWEDCHEKPDWDFERFLGNKIRAMMANLSTVSNHSHFARLFQKQLLQLCKGPSGGKGAAGIGDNPDQDLLNMLGSDNLNRLKRLQERFVAPQTVGGPCPPPSFPGYQEFFRDFILTAGNYQFNQHLMDSLCQEIQELDTISIVGHESTDGESSMDEQDEKIRFGSILLTVRLLAKFLGFLTFLPYRTTESLTGELLESAVALRNQAFPMLDVLQLLRRSIQDHRTVLTIPWAVEYLSWVDGVAPHVEYYRKVFCCLLHLYRYKLILTDEKEMGILNKLLILAVLGWLFQVLCRILCVFFRNSHTKKDCVPLVDQQLLYSCCPYLGELRKLLVSFVAGCGSKNGGFVRKITPTAAEQIMLKPSLSQKKLQAELEQAFFHNQPPSLRRSVEFVAERIGSNCVKHIKATLVADLVKRAEIILQDKVTEDSAGQSKLLESVCTKLCEDGRQALQQAQEYCKRKAPEAVRVLLPEETSACVMKSAEDIAVSLAIEKACTWLSTNISALIKREVKATFNRMVRTHMTSSFADSADVKKCCDDCKHKVTLPSRLIIEIKEFLCISMGPRNVDEALELAQLKSFLERLSQTLNCQKYITSPAEQHLAKCTVELVSLLVSDQVPLVDFPLSEQCNLHENQCKREAVSQLLRLMLTIWKNDFVVPVPIQLIFSDKNMKNFIDVHTQEQWELFAILLQQLLEFGLIQHNELEEHIFRLQKYNWPLQDLLPALDQLVLGSENHSVPKDPASLLVPQTEIIAPS
uniref:Codanin-1 C-terminal domain-containing protein n=1 Tax=Pyxicephalus adspersus TaxID=30357 RepID=A0AAV2ZJW8_PYXAD|nr:TPA: hypothetical protein GDO54_005292 [Pyxicephalus adspersus]